MKHIILIIMIGSLFGICLITYKIDRLANKTQIERLGYQKTMTKE